MKTKLFITIMILGFVVKSWGQKQEEIEINPFGTDKPISKTEKGNSVKFKISNVNTFKINGFTESKPLSVNFEVPEIFNDFINSKESENNGNNENSNISYNVADFKKKFETIKRDLDGNILTKELANNLLSELKKVQDEIFQNNLSTFKTSFSVFVSKYNAVHQQIELEGKLLEQIKDSVFIRNTIVLKNNVKEYFKSVYGSKTTEEAKKTTETDLNNLMLEYTQLLKIYDELNKTLEKDSVVLNGKLESSDKKTTINIDKATVSQERKKYFSEEMTFANKVFETISDIKNRNEIIKKAQQGIDWYNKIDQESYTIYTDAIQLNDYETTVTPKLKFSNGNIAHEFQPLTIKTFGGIKVNFSTGYLVSFIGDDNFSPFKDNSGNTIGVVESNKNAVTNSLGGLVHVYPNWKNSPQLGLSAGASLATNGNLGFYFGGSLFFLEKNRLVITGGYSFIKVKQLNSSNLNKISNDRYEFVSTTDTEIRYDDVYKGGWFIGITYNLSK
jgi:hypothetical protein